MLNKKKICNQCQKLKYVWKSINGKPHCQKCAMSVSKSKKIINTKQYIKINNKSSTQVKLDAAYKVLRDIFIKNHPMCQVNILGVCTLKSTDVHHSRGKGEYLCDTTTFIPTCRACHTWIHENNKKAQVLGFIKSRLEIIS